MNAYHLPQDVRATRFLPARHFDGVDAVITWHDVSPRLGVSYDLFGNGKTALKATLNRYVAALGIGGILTDTNPVLTSVVSANRTWTDRNGDFIPDCDFNNSAANGECGVLQNLNFGKNNPRATQYDPDVLHGFGHRGYNWETSASIQHELRPGVAVNAAYFRRWFGNLTATDNQLVTPADYDPYCLTVPVDSRLAEGGGNKLCGFYDVKPALQGQSQNFVTFADNFGGGRSSVYNGVDLTVSARLRGGAQVSGGTSIGRLENENCQVIDSPGGTPLTGQSSNTFAFCDNKPPFQQNVKFLGVYPLPWWGLQASGAFQSLPGPEISATTYVATNDEVRTTLGRNLAAGANATVTLPLIENGTTYAKRWSKLDVRFSKIVRLGSTRVTGSLDVFNLFNQLGVVDVNTRYGSNWLYPRQILGARLFRLSGQIDF